MARTGRRPRPVALKVLQGERPSRINDDELPVPPGPPTPPSGMSAGVAADYAELVRLLEPTGVLCALDGPALAAFAQVMATHRAAAALESEVGVLVRDEKGRPRINPVARVRRDAGRDIMRWATEFGMTPAARSSIRARLAGGVGAPPPNATAAKYLSGGAS